MPYRDDETVLVRVFTRESRVETKLEELAKLGFEGFTVLRAIAGYGTDGKPASADIVIESLDLPVVVEFFTTYGKFKERENLLKEIVPGLVTIERATLDP